MKGEGEKEKRLKNGLKMYLSGLSTKKYIGGGDGRNV